MKQYKQPVTVFLLCLIYIILIVGILPSKGAILVVILSTFSGTSINEALFWLILIFEVFLQASFLVIFFRIRDDITKLGLSAPCVLLLLVVILIGSPFLFAESHQFITILTNIYSVMDVPIPSHSPAMISMRTLPITPEFFWIYSIANLAISAFFGALLIGLIQPWTTSRRVVYTIVLIPILIITTIVMYMLFSRIIGAFISEQMTSI